MEEFKDFNFNKLEWNTVCDILQQQAQTKLAKIMCFKIELFNSCEIIELKLNQLQNCLNVIERKDDIDLTELQDLSDLIISLKPGFILNPEQLVSIKKMFEIVAFLNNKFLKTNIYSTSEIGHLQNIVKELILNDFIVESISQILDDEAKFKDDASQIHFELITKIRQSEVDLKSELMTFIQHPRYSKALQEPIYTKRNDRFVVPVKAGFKNEIKGIIHDVSSSGLTQFIEPFVIVNISNKIQKIYNELENERINILKQISSDIIKFAKDIKLNFDYLTQIDILFAKARFAKLYDGSKPIINDNNTLVLKKLKHPILNINNKFVANDINLSFDKNTLIITGPNAGGKTVMLKSIALACLMAKAAMFICAQKDSCVCIFDKIFTCIGDSQSIEFNLSTFSGHLTIIKEIIDKSDNRSLVLIDEIASGTNPQEGIVLAKAIIEELNNKKSINIFTTHYEDLIALFKNDDSVIYGGFEYDNINLQSTFKFRTFYLSSSYAIDLARKLKFKASIIDRALEILKNEYHTNYSLQILKDKETQIQSQQEYINEQLKIIEIENKNISDFKNYNKSQLESEIEYLKHELNLEKSKILNQINSIIKDLQSDKSLLKASQAKDSLNDIVLAYDKQLDSHIAKQSHDIIQFKVGDNVKVKSLSVKGVISRIKNNNSNLEIYVKTTKFELKVKPDDLALININHKDKNQNFKASKNITNKKVSTADIIVGDFNTINIIGKKADEALIILESFLDSCYIKDFNCVLIIHGHGKGILKSVVHDYLKSSTYVRSYDFSPIEYGGTGSTIAYLN